MIKLLEKAPQSKDGILLEYGALLRYTQDYHKRLSIIKRCLYKEKCLKGGKSVTASSALTVIMYVPSSEAKTKSVEFGAKVNNIE